MATPCITHQQVLAEQAALAEARQAVRERGARLEAMCREQALEWSDAEHTLLVQTTDSGRFGSQRRMGLYHGRLPRVLMRGDPVVVWEMGCGAPHFYHWTADARHHDWGGLNYDTLKRDTSLNSRALEHFVFTTARKGAQPVDVPAITRYEHAAAAPADFVLWIKEWSD